MNFDLPVTFTEELKAITMKYLKEWLGLTKIITEIVLYSLGQRSFWSRPYQSGDMLEENEGLQDALTKIL